MKAIIAFLLVAIVVTQIFGDSAQESEWEAYKKKYGKNYDAAEDAKRHEIYLKTKKIVDEHNAKYEKGEVSYKLELNKFADWTDEERAGLVDPPKLPNVTEVPEDSNAVN